MKTMKYINIPDRGVTFAVPPKCGSSSVYASLQEHFGVDNLAHSHDVRLLRANLVPREDEIIFVVRHPVDRFRSLWRNKCRDGGKLNGVYDALHGLTPDELFSFIKTYGNHHWQHQMKMADSLPWDANITFVPLERLSKWWERNTDYPPLEVRNETVDPFDPEISPELEAAIKVWYASDLSRWEKTRL